MPRVKDDSMIINTKIYKLVSEKMKTRESKFRAHVAKFINDRHELIYALAPYDRILYNRRDIDDLFKSLDIDEKEILSMMKETNYYSIPNNPQCAKEPYVIVVFCIIKYYMKINKRNFSELSCIYLAFTGKFYASLHGLLWKKFPPSRYPQVMDYVINNVLSAKFSLKSEGTIYGAIKAMCITYLQKYEKLIKADDTTDNEIGGPNGLLQQLRDREKNFLKNIANEYYIAFQNRNYLNYEQDNLSEEGFRLTDNDAAYAARISDNTVNYMTSNSVSLDVCNKCKNEDVSGTEIKDIMETILGNNDNIPEIKRVINIYICDFLKNYPKTNVGSIEFVAYSIKAKPNSKDKYINECKETILSWLDENSPTYRKRKSRAATQNNYYRSVALYIILTINKIARR